MIIASSCVCNGNSVRFKHAQTFLLTTPINIPMLYQGDDIGMFGEDKTVDGNNFDGGRRAVMKFDNLSPDEKAALKHVQNLGKFRKEHPALRYGKREKCSSTDDAWVFKLKCTESDNKRCNGGDTVIVGINKGSSPYPVNCGESGTFTSYDGSSVGNDIKVPAGGSLVIGK